MKTGDGGCGQPGVSACAVMGSGAEDTEDIRVLDWKLGFSPRKESEWAAVLVCGW